MEAKDWYEGQESVSFPSLLRGDIFLSMNHHKWYSRWIRWFQKNGKFSHCGVYAGEGHTIEATFPKGGTNFPLKKYMAKKYTLVICRVPDLSFEDRNHFVAEAAKIAPHPYDNLNILRHAIDNVISRLTRFLVGKGFRPLARFVPDIDKDGRNICSEMVGFSWYRWEHRPIGFVSPGQEVPEDVYDGIFKKHGGTVIMHHIKGEIQDA